MTMSSASSPAGPSASTHLVEEAARGCIYGCWETIPRITRLGSRILNPPTSMWPFFALTSNRNRTFSRMSSRSRGPLLVADLVGFSLDMEDSISVNLLQKTGTTAGDCLGFGARGRERPNKNNEPKSGDPKPDTLHGVVSFLNPPFRSRTSRTL